MCDHLNPIRMMIIICLVVEIDIKVIVTIIVPLHWLCLRNVTCFFEFDWDLDMDKENQHVVHNGIEEMLKP